MKENQLYFDNFTNLQRRNREEITLNKSRKRYRDRFLGFVDDAENTYVHELTLIFYFNLT